MKLMFVRHAEPDYRIDSLTPKGHREAQMLAQRLCKLDVKAFYVSPLGRAKDTAAYTLNALGRTAEVMPWLAEFRGRCTDTLTGASRIPWDFQPRLWQPRKRLRDMDAWLEDELVQGGDVEKIWQESCEGIDDVLASHGYIRSEGNIYRCNNNTPDTLVFFCHFGITAALVGHLLGISPLNMWQGFCAQPSSVTTLITEERVKGEVVFRCIQLGDISHLYAGDERYSTAGLYPECYTGIDDTCPPECHAHGT